MSSVVSTRTVTQAAPQAYAKVSLSAPKEEEPIDLNIPDNYVQWVLKNQKELPPITWQTLLSEIKWLDFSILTITPAIALWGIFNVNLRWETAVWSVIYYFITGLGKYRDYAKGSDTHRCDRDYGGLSSSLGAPIV